MLAYLEHLADAEGARRNGVPLPIGLPAEAIDEREAVASLAAAIALRDGEGNARIRRVYRTVVDLLARGTRH